VPKKKADAKDWTAQWPAPGNHALFWSGGTTTLNWDDLTTTTTTTTSPITFNYKTYWNDPRNIQKVVFVVGHEDWTSWADAIMPGFGKWLEARNPSTPFYFGEACFFYAGE
jgi:hypothetical protein